MWTPQDPDHKAYLTYQGPLPSALFRYRSVRPDTIDRLIDFEILQEGIFLSALKDLNDPDEGRLLVRFSGSDDEILAFWRKSIREEQSLVSDDDVEEMAQANLQRVLAERYTAPDHVAHLLRHVMTHVIRVACFTTSPTNFSMWANYAKHFGANGNSIDHAGVCIEYRCHESWRGAALHPVVYSDEVPVINPVGLEEEAFAKIIYMKSREWRAEEEWRISSVLQAKPPFEGNWQVNAKMKIEGAVAAVIFGMNAPQETVEKFTTRVKKARPDIALKRVVRNPLTWVREVVPVEALKP